MSFQLSGSGSRSMVDKKAGDSFVAFQGHPVRC
jgi:hypothetical protein